MFQKGRLVGFVLTALFLWFAVRNVDPSELAVAFRDADYRLVLPAALATLCGYLLRTVRWQGIVRPVAPLPFREAFAVLMMGFAANNLLPARLGELVRAYLLRRKTGVRKTYGVATVLLERVCDGLTLIAFLSVVSLLMPLPVWGQEVQVVSSLVFLGATAGILALLTQERRTVRILTVLLGSLSPRLSGPVLRAAGTFISGLDALRNRRQLAMVIALSVVVWLLEGSSYLLISRSFGIHMPFAHQLLAAVFLLVVVNLGIMIPSAPGYIGTFQWLVVTALDVFGVPKETALAIGITSHLMQYLMVTMIGVVFFFRENLGLRSLGTTAASEAEDEDSAVPATVR